jgi:hypothetical protein
LDEYELNFYNHAQTRHLDSLQKIRVKEIYDYHLSKSFNSYVYLINP